MEEFLTKFNPIFRTGTEHLKELENYLRFLESPLCDPDAVNSDGMLSLLREWTSQQKKFLNKYRDKFQEEQDGKST